MRNKTIFSLAVLAMAVITILVSFRCSDYFEDNLYNTGTIIRSAFAGPGPLLRTSMVTEYFIRYPVERAEDWHRSLSMLVASQAVRLTGALALISILHVVYLGIFGTMLFFLFRRAALDGPREDATGNRAGRANWIALAAIAALAFSPAGLLILSRTAMDDPLAGCLALGGLLLILSSDFPSKRAAACAGLCFGTAFWAKDLCLLWTGLGSLILLVNLFVSGSRVTLSRLTTALLPGIVSAPIAAGKLLWNHADLGTYLPTLALTENRIYIYGFYTGYNPHFPFYLTGNDKLGSAVELAGGLLPAIKAAVLVQIPAVQALVDAFVPVAPLLVAALFVTHRYTASRPFFARVSRATAVVFVVFACFFLSGTSTVDQPRYWIVPVGIACGLGLIHGIDLLSGSARTLPVTRLAVLGLLYAIGIYQVPGAYLGLRKAPLIEPAIVDWVHQKLAHGDPRDTVALNGRQAFHYYAQTGDRIVAIWPAALTKLSPDQIRHWLSDYHVGWALLADGDIVTRTALEQIGFTAARQDGGFVVMRPLSPLVWP